MRKYLLLLLIATLLTGCNQHTSTECIEDISCYYDFSTVDWDELSEKYYRPNIADWDTTIDECIADGFPSDVATELWHLLQNARTDFHQKLLPLRSEVSNRIIQTIDRTEAMFDTVFVRCVSQEYYMRLFPEIYNETMKPAIDELTKRLQ